MTVRFGRTAACLFASLALSACITTSNAPAVPKITPTDSPWLEASPVLKMQIQDQAERLPWTHGVERVEAVSWFAQVGEPAYPILLEMCSDPRPEVAGCAFAALGATGDQRLVPYLLEVEVKEGQSESLRYERARTLVRLGDWSTIGTLIDGLRQQDVLTRALCDQALFQATGERFGFDPRGTDAERDAAIQRWDAWLAARKNDPYLASR